MYEDLNEKQIILLDFLKEFIKLKGYPPSYREIIDEIKVIKSTSTINSYIIQLEKKGYVRRDPSKNRALEIIDLDSYISETKKETFDIPIIGKVTAGEPILAVENIEDTFPLPLEYASKGELFILNVSGESMIEAGILDGDKIVVRKQNTAENGDIVVALLDDSATVKRYFKHKDHIELRPENSSMYPIITKEVNVLGKVIGLFREI
ncbi:transcriptional repressor LexA [Lagierella sp.]|uniref:transcriptional repressor LexA n=1 Tax=Lagierella sp. TaxID=2849657 RepID=UPI00262535EE|nr:transcriptional repressor LexA [Lagierella sp.]